MAMGPRGREDRRRQGEERERASLKGKETGRARGRSTQLPLTAQGHH